MTAWPNAATPAVAPEPIKETPEEFQARRNVAIEKWRQAKFAAEATVEVERSYRAEVTSICFPNPTKGTQRHDIGSGYNMKLVYGLTYTLGNKDKVDDAGFKVSIRTQIEELEQNFVKQHGEAAELLLSRLITWKPELSGSEYEKLDRNNPLQAALGAAIDEVLTIKPASPQLTFEEPKGK